MLHRGAMPVIESYCSGTDSVSPLSLQRRDTARTTPCAGLPCELTGDDAGDVRPVTGLVAQGTLLTRRLRKRIVQREIVVLEPVTEVEILVRLEVRMSSVDARVDDGPHDVIAQRGERAVRSVGFHRAHRFHEQRLDLEVRPDAEDRARARRRSLAGR